MIDIKDYLGDFPYLNPDLNPLNPPMLRLTCVGVKSRNYPQYQIDNSERLWHTWRFQYTISGKGIVEYEGKTYNLKENDAFFLYLPSNSRYYPDPDSNEPWRFMYITFVSSIPMFHIVQNLFKEAGPVFSLNPDSSAIIALIRLINDRRENKIHESLMATGSVLDFFYKLYYCVSTGHKDLSARNQRIVQLMESEYATLTGVDSIAEKLNLTPSYITRVFRADVGITPIEYLNRIRINHSLTLLTSTDLSVKEIGLACGFSSTSYFCKIFRRYKKISPSKFRFMCQ